MQTTILETKLTDGSSVFTLQVTSATGDVIELGCYGQESAESLQSEMRRCAISMDIVVNN